MKTKNIMTLLVATVLIGYINLFSQNCPPDAVQWSGSLNITSQFGIYPGSASVSYQKGMLGNDYVVKVDWSTLQINDSPTIIESAWRKILEDDIVRTVVPYQNLPENLQVNVVFYYQKECKTQTRLALNLDITTSIRCCTDNTEIESQIIGVYKDGNFHKVYYIYKDIVCGYKCCKRVYNCTVTYDQVNNKKGLNIDNVAIYSVTNCSGDSQNINCITSLPTPCIDGTCD